MRRGTVLRLLFLVMSASGTTGPWIADAAAQGEGCTTTVAEAPAREIIRCRYVTIEVEPGSDLQPLDANGDGEPEGVTLGSGALLIEYDPPPGGGSFQILTPYAIASVRGTIWVVDAQPLQTSVFVVQGAVGVAEVDGAMEVLLHAGDGVDVGPGTEALQVRRWAAERAARLLARFGR